MKGNTKKARKKDSKTRNKKKVKKEEFVNLKQIQNMKRNEILESLAKHKKESDVFIKELQSVRDLGKKRKREALPKQHNEHDNGEHKETELINYDNDNNDNINDNESSSSSSSPSIHITEHHHQPDITQTKEELLKQIHETNEHQRYLEDLAELKSIIFDDATLPKPPLSSQITVNRLPHITTTRKSLPIINQEHDIMYAINNSLVTIIHGETGSGKSTQIPQFIYETGYTNCFGQIIITQPRRVAARSLSTRLAEELNVQLGNEVGYQIRYESENVSAKTVIRFVTDGILLKEFERDNLLLKYAVIIIDEAHERSINTDLLIGFISQIIKVRYALWKQGKEDTEGQRVFPLRLIIMSATLRVDEFVESKLFKPNITPRVVEVNTRMFKVNVLHCKHTKEDYVGEAFKFCVKIHRKLPEGNVLVFLTGKREINELCGRLNEEFEKGSYSDNTTTNNNENNVNEEENIINDDNINVNEDNNNNSGTHNYKPYIILPLYSSMSQQDQNKIYADHNNKRMFVISTNVAETSLTIPNIRYVIDSGKVKKRIYKTGLSFSSFQVEWISQASANQRTGRAGRTCEGYCYRLYSNGLYVKMPQFTEPQILTTPLSQVILTLKSMKVNNIYTFPFITFPNQLFITKAIEHLTVIGALQSKNDEHELRLLKLKQLLLTSNNNDDSSCNELNDSTSISDLGMLMSKFPLEPKLSKVLIMAKSFGLIEYGIMIVGLLSVETPFEFNALSYTQLVNVFKQHNIYNYKSDIVSYVNLLLLILQNKLTGNTIKYHHRKVEEIKNIINQLYSISTVVFGKTTSTALTPYTSLPLINSTQSHLLYQILLCAYIDNIARKQIIYITNNDNTSNNTNEQVLKKQIIYESNEVNIKCKLHYHSFLNEQLPSLVLYHNIINENHNSYLYYVSIVKEEWLYNIGSSVLIKEDLNVTYKEPFYNKYKDCVCGFVNLTYGYKEWCIENVAVKMKKGDAYYRYMARFILDGSVVEGMKKYVGKLNAKSRVITDKFGDMQIKVAKMVKELKDNDVDSKEALVKKWKEDKMFLLNTVLLWFNDIGVKEEIKRKWPMM